MTLRNLIPILVLSLFLTWYVSNWAYKTLYLEQRTALSSEIEKYSKDIVLQQQRLDAANVFYRQYVGYFYRSLPRIQNDARSQYSFWMLELLQYSGLEETRVETGPPSRIPLGGDYQTTIRCAGSLAQLSYFLFEFYNAPFLHRLTSLTLAPIEGSTEKMTFSMTVNALVLVSDERYNPFPVTNQLPQGRIMRLASSDLAPYQVISERNLLQTARGGIDQADYTFLTAIIHSNQADKTEAWFSVRTDDSRITAKLGDPVHSGSFSGRIVEIYDQDVVLDRNGSRWLLSIGEGLYEAFALPPETALQNE